MRYLVEMSRICLNCGTPAPDAATTCAKCGSSRIADLSKPLDAAAVLSDDDGRKQRLRWDLRDVAVLAAASVALLAFFAAWVAVSVSTSKPPPPPPPSVVAYLGAEGAPAEAMLSFEATLPERAARAEACMRNTEPVGRQFVADFKRTRAGVSTSVRGTGGSLADCMAFEWLGDSLDPVFVRVEVPFEIDGSDALSVPKTVPVVYPPKPKKTAAAN